MLAKTFTCSLLGIDALMVEVEVDHTPGLTYFTLVGLPDNIVRESRERVKAALLNSGYEPTHDRLTVNLAPAHVKKEGAGFDLPIAVGMLAVFGEVPTQRAGEVLMVGELALDGRVKPVSGALPMAIAARENGYREMILPRENAREAAVTEGVSVLPVEHLSDVIDLLNGRREIEPVKVDCAELFAAAQSNSQMDFNEVRGQEHAKRGLEVAAAGGHNVLMVGPPGSGKTMLAQRLGGILPPLGFEEALETSKIFSVSALLNEDPLVTRRPFRAPHHTVSDAGLIGGGHVPRPGEVSLAHNGVLFLDEFPEFRRNILDLLRQPLEDGRVTIARSTMTLTFPARFMLVAAMNPCPCGYATDPVRECTCAPHAVKRYRSRISGPVLDRIDLHVDVPAVRYKDLQAPAGGTPSAAIRERVVAARDRQLQRLEGRGVYCNAHMSPRHIKQFCKLDAAGDKLLESAMERLGLSARAYHRILKVSRTIADLEGIPDIAAEHVLEAIQYRSLDRELF